MNLLVLLWKDEIIYSYKVIDGKSKGSLGIKVAELAGFPNDVILEANALLGEFEKGGVNEKDIVVSEEDYEKQRLLKVKFKLVLEELVIIFGHLKNMELCRILLPLVSLWAMDIP